MPPAKRRRGAGIGIVVGVLVLALLVVAVVVILRVTGETGPLPGEERCVATANDNSVAVDVKQAHYASIIVGLSVRRGLKPRAGSIAMATVYQETGIRNLDYGDRDSVGLFQQRPSQGWGTKRQLMDPYYATGKFYDALVKIDGWENEDITKIAQQIQISGHPEAYRDHERDGRILASALSGQSAGGFSCLVRGKPAGHPDDLAADLKKTFRASPSANESAKTVTVKAKSTGAAWAYAHYAVANAKAYGVTTVRLGDRSWQSDSTSLPTWTGPVDGARTVTITTR